MRPGAKLAAAVYVLSVGHSYGYLVGYGGDPIASLALAAVVGPPQALSLAANAAGRQWAERKRASTSVT